MEKIDRRKPRKGGGRYAKFEKKRQVSIALEEAQYQYIAKQARLMSTQEETCVTVTDMFRRALDICYPMPKQTEFLDEKGRLK